MSRRTITKQEASRRGLAIAIAIILTIAVVAGLLATGFVVIQPIGALPDGVTIWYWRAGLHLPFIQSPDGLSLDRTGSVSMLSRMAGMAALTDAIDGRIIARFGYMDWMYSVSTGGTRFEK